MSSPTPIPVPIGRRVTAYILDYVLLQIVMGVFISLMFGDQVAQWMQAFIKSVEQNTPPPNPSQELMLCLLAIPFFYATIFWTILGALPAQFLLKMKVVHHQTLRYLNPLQASLRYFGLTMIVMFITIIPIIAPILIFFVLHFASKDTQKRAIHDYLAKSMVIDVSPNAQAPEENANDTTGRAF